MTNTRKQEKVSRKAAQLAGGERARYVWLAAFGEERPLPEQGALLALEDRLDRAADWANLIEGSPPRERLEQIAAAAEKLTRLLAEEQDYRARIERYWPFAFHWPSLSQTRIGLVCLKRAARRASKRRLAPAGIRENFVSRNRLFVVRCASVYLEHTAIEPGIGYSDLTFEIDGPFVRFVQEAARQFKLSPPDGETVARALKDAKALK